ncbi:hypothetical protein M8J77_004708 [Diaphorina citri]|nr:hypothetical protein M8J77_004708 [Diaphorina citri]
MKISIVFMLICIAITTTSASPLFNNWQESADLDRWSNPSSSFNSNNVPKDNPNTPIQKRGKRSPTQNKQMSLSTTDTPDEKSLEHKDSSKNVQMTLIPTVARRRSTHRIQMASPRLEPCIPEVDRSIFINRMPKYEQLTLLPTLMTKATRKRSVKHVPIQKGRPRSNTIGKPKHSHVKQESGPTHDPMERSTLAIDKRAMEKFMDEWFELHRTYDTDPRKKEPGL